MLNWAVDAGVIAQNPVGRLKRLPTTRDHQRYRRRALSEGEIARFLAASEADDAENELRAALEGITRVPQTPLWLTLLETGARWNEARLATWGDVDLRKRLLTLRAENTKSRKVRVIPFREGLAGRLRALRPQHEAVLGRLPTVQDRVFVSPEGVPLPRPTTNAMRVFDRLLDRAGIPKTDLQGEKLDIHAVRHSFASRLARAGVGITHAQHLLGHSDPKLTAQVYTHVRAEDLRPAIDALPELERAPVARVKEAR
jgi:integrase